MVDCAINGLPGKSDIGAAEPFPLECLSMQPPVHRVFHLHGVYHSQRISGMLYDQCARIPALASTAGFFGNKSGPANLDDSR